MTAVLPGTAVITRPRHPLHGLELRVLGGMRRHGRLELLLVLPDGSKRLIPAEWTSQHADSTAAVDLAAYGIADLEDVGAERVHGVHRGERLAALGGLTCRAEQRAPCRTRTDGYTR